ncbi:hypothetical protein N7495_000946 [Penicillium taxi]|uniref:uncharacterized protein n=1 Tax=Penicillium taxi TaxID=168475 RepID=UPI002545AC86|nr:uncharacterized protein N7495_000946 [Penicillium taxi]KAJ5908264.1 hypothetical protein N7495_000946 [Penicillium taxi]
MRATRFGLRVALCATSLIVFGCYLLQAHLREICTQYRAGQYLADWLDRSTTTTPRPHYNAIPEDKVIVMAKLNEENTDWVATELPDWQRAIYTVNPTQELRNDDNVLTTPINKGNEAMAYLTYVIDHYYVLPSTIAFLHSHRAGFLMAWHVDAPLHDNVNAMRMLQLDFVQKNGYANLRCNWNPGCMESGRVNRHVTSEVWWEIFVGTSTPPLNQSSPFETETSGQKYLHPPTHIAAACCAQFAVTKDQVRKRPRDDYVKFRQWLIETELKNAKSGRVMEYLWHIIFNMDAVYCPDEELCYCQVYGKC